MNTRMFGRLVASLRRQTMDFESGNRLSQKRLAELTGISDKVIGNLERGTKAIAEPDILQRLAEVFGLSLLEFREFVLAASAVDVNRNAMPANMAMDNLIEQLALIQSPDCVADPLGNLVAANGALMRFTQYANLKHEEDSSTALQFHHVRWMLNTDNALRIIDPQLWEGQLAARTWRFRATSLGYRHTQKFQQVLSALLQYTDFQRAWLALKPCAEEKAAIPSVYRDHAGRRLHYTVGETQVLTNAGELYLAILAPLSVETEDFFGDLSATRDTVQLLAPWPDTGMDAWAETDLN